jgi:transposase
MTDSPALEYPRDLASVRGLTVRDVARRYRVGQDKVRAWIRRAELRAINTATVLCGKPRWVIPPDALVEFEKRRAGGPQAKPIRHRKRSPMVDYYPDVPTTAPSKEALS